MGAMFKQYWSVWLAMGLVVGLAASRFWPEMPTHAVATDRAENIVLTTVPVDGEVEAVFMLDSLTGTLRGGVPARQAPGAFQSTWERSVAADLAQAVGRFNQGAAVAAKGGGGRPEIQLPQSPKYMMTSGMIDIPGRTNIRPARAMLYVAEASTGIVMAYVVPWNQASHSAGQAFSSPLQLWAAAPFATTIIRPEE